MSRRTHAAFAFALALPTFALPPAAAAQGEPAPPPAPPEVRVYTFEPEDVAGVIRGPEGELETVRLADRLPSLIRVRPDFRPELLQSAADL